MSGVREPDRARTPPKAERVGLAGRPTDFCSLEIINDSLATLSSATISRTLGWASHASRSCIERHSWLRWETESLPVMPDARMMASTWAATADEDGAPEVALSSTWQHTQGAAVCEHRLGGCHAAKHHLGEYRMGVGM